MAFNRPGNGRDGKSNISSNRPANGGDRPKKASPARGKSTPNSDTSNNARPSRKYNTETTGEKKSFSRGKSSFTEGAGDKKTFSPKSKPYTGRTAGEPEGKPFVKSKPYSGRTGEGDKKPFSSRGKSGGFGDKKFGDKKFGDKPAARGGFKKPFSDKPYSTDRPKRTRTDFASPEFEAPAKTMRGRKKTAEPKDDGLIRLNRYISNSGICSRRKADELITAGVVSVNGEVISELGYKVDPVKDQVRYNGELLKREKMVYVLLNKPKDYITTTEDPQERRTVMHLVEKASRERIYPVGRLDRNTTGLLLMTNDGDLADKLSHPRNNIVKLYHVELNKGLTQGDLNKISFGLELEDGLIKPDSVSYVAGGSKREVGIQIHSGKNRIVRRIFEHLGYEVVKLDRAVYANLTKKDLPRGRWRYLDEKEVIQLKHLV
ncbi:pseudouridine synthase [Mucilaginibacter sp. L3T2-6]|uniref:pseudouridine synthase n=1 Tax=Mucilaginibacter sp. L3T2-6 TaxID=3062491 RepID=UPI00267642EF|nr:pseudouridine synthase [Mucilaginibacter sp. L3T2-6]MDO3641846.1 pseudouridine synthase [Mucilaginibacter sp. L3T2-6]MDV6214476.1 pseudouridine synthase [Mucilaginibacter sp. L3T2-6]